MSHSKHQVNLLQSTMIATDNFDKYLKELMSKELTDLGSTVDALQKLSSLALDLASWIDQCELYGLTITDLDQYSDENPQR